MRAHVTSPDSWLRRAPTLAKLVVTLLLILGVAALPPRHASWACSVVLPLLLLLAYSARVPLASLLRSLLFALPLVGGLASLVLVQQGALACIALVGRVSLSMLSLRLLASSTPISAWMRTLRRAGLPEVLCTTIALLHRYLFLLADESTRMRRARAGRTLQGGRLAVWQARGSAIGLLFVRTVSRAERVHAAVRSRGGA